MKKLIWLLVLVVVTACSKVTAPNAGFEVQDFGTTGSDFGFAVAALPTGVGAVVVGSTEGSLDGVNKGSSDAFIRHYDGGVVWANQFGTRASDSAYDVALHSSGVKYVLGDTRGALGFKVGSQDVFLRKYSSTGALLWTRQFGTTGDDFAKKVVVAGNFIYTLSQENNPYGFTVRKWNASGTVLLTIQNNQSVSSGEALAIDSLGNLHVAVNDSSLGPTTVKLFSYTPTGTLLSPQRTIFNPTIVAYAYDMIIDSSDNLYVVIHDQGADTSGRGAVLRKLTMAGIVVWSKNVGQNELFFSQSLALDNNGNIYVAGDVYQATFPGFVNAGQDDIFVRKYSPTGTVLWTFQIGGNKSDSAYGVAVSDAVYVTGSSDSNPNLVGDDSYGSNDAFLIQLKRSTGALVGIDQ
jgi:hypothetical protein